MSLSQQTEFHQQGTKLALDLLAIFCHQSAPQTSIIFSPFSIRNCLALAFTGANDATADEIANLMKYASNNKDEVAKIFHDILETYSKGSLVKIANKVYVQNGHQLRKEYATTLADSYQAETENVNFAENQKAAQNINRWVEEKTNGKITQLVSEDSLDESTRLVLLNAIHFKGDWERKFSSDATQDADFWLNDTEKVSLPFMRQKSKFFYGYFEDLNCTALEMAYKDSDLSMFILLPNEINGLAALLEQLKVNFNLKELYSRMNPEDVIVNFPKFKVEFSQELSKTFKQMGFSKMFGSEAQFNDMLETEAAGVQISRIFHKASIEVNEEGSEASAATGMVMMMRMMMPQFQFNADHPFLYFIWNRENVLFAGVFKS